MSFGNINPSLTSSAIIAMTPYNAPPETVVQFDGLEIKWHNSAANSYDGIAIRTQSGTRSMRYTTVEFYLANAVADAGKVLFGSNNTWYNLPNVGAVGTLSNLTYPYARNVDTTFIGFGNPAMPNADLRQYVLYDDTNQATYRITIDKQAATGEVLLSQNGTCMITVERVGITSLQTLAPGYGLGISNGVIIDANRAARVAPMATAQAGTTLVLGELSFRYSLNATNGNLDIQSATATPVACKAYGEEYFPALGTARNLVGPGAGSTAPAAGATWLTLPVGGLGADEMLFYEIFTASNLYTAKLASFGVSSVHLIVEKAV